jgi:LPXTG-motif cell wall-anchored protein
MTIGFGADNHPWLVVLIVAALAAVALLWLRSRS